MHATRPVRCGTARVLVATSRVLPATGPVQHRTRQGLVAPSWVLHATRQVERVTPRVSLATSRVVYATRSARCILRRVQEPPRVALLRALLADPTLRKRLVLLASSRLKPWSNVVSLVVSAEDVVHQAVEKVLSGRTPWDPAKKTLEWHLGSVVNSVAWHAVDNAAARRSEPFDDDKHEAVVRDPSPNAEEQMIARQDKSALDAFFARCMDRLVLELRERADDEGLKLLDLMEHAVVDYEEQAKALETSVSAVKLAHKRITYHARRIGDEERAKRAASPRPLAKQGTS